MIVILLIDIHYYIYSILSRYCRSFHSIRLANIRIIFYSAMQKQKNLHSEKNFFKKSNVIKK